MIIEGSVGIIAAVLSCYDFIWHIVSVNEDKDTFFVHSHHNGEQELRNPNVPMVGPQLLSLDSVVGSREIKYGMIALQLYMYPTNESTLG